MQKQAVLSDLFWRDYCKSLSWYGFSKERHETDFDYFSFPRVLRAADNFQLHLNRDNLRFQSDLKDYSRYRPHRVIPGESLLITIHISLKLAGAAAFIAPRPALFIIFPFYE